MIEATENKFEDRPSIYEVEQVIWNGGKGKTYILLVEAFSLNEAMTLSGGEDGIHEIVGIKKIGSICLRSSRLNKDLIKKVFSNIQVTSSEKYSSHHQVNVSPDRVRITADMDLRFFEIELGLRKRLEEDE